MANTAKKTASGKWRVRVYDYTDAAGIKHVKTITAPTRAQAELLAAQFVHTKKMRQAAAGTVGGLCDDYIRLTEPVISPATATGYRKIRRVAFPDLMACPVEKLTPAVVQRAINAEISRGKGKGRGGLSAKTVRNEWAFVSAALSEFAGLRFSPRLPAYHVAPKDLPDPAAVMAAVRGSDVEVPVLLALCLSLTMSEVRGLKCSDIEGGFLTVRRVVVDTDAGPVVKNTGKAATRFRRLVLADFLAALINDTTVYKKYRETGDDGFIEPRGWSVIYKHFRRDMAAAGLSLTFHNLRALNASAMLALGVPDKYAMERGGWSTPSVMKKYYQNTLDQERRRVDDNINNHFAALYAQAYYTEKAKR